MTKSKSMDTTLLIGLFSTLVVMDWLYVRWIKQLFEEVATSWFLIVPVLGYFYVTFAVIAIVYMRQKKQLGLVLGCIVILFGMIADVMSYAAVFKMSGMYELLIIPLIVFNCIMLIFLIGCKDNFKKD